MITADWHIHSRNSCDCKAGAIPTTMAETVAAIEATGIEDYGITDHLHTPFNLPDIASSRREFDALPPSPHRHFGIEVSVVSKWELHEIASGRQQAGEGGLRTGGPAWAAPAIGLTEETIAEYGIEYVVGGTHWPLYVPIEREAIIRDYHRQNLFLLCHPLVTIIAHPWWWMGYWRDEDGAYRTDPWLDDFGKVPHALHEEFAAAAREHGTVVEINLHAILLNVHYPEAFKKQYCEFLAWLKSTGVMLSIGSDHHAQHHHYAQAGPGQPTAEETRQASFSLAEAMLTEVGLHDADMWRLPAEG